MHGVFNNSHQVCGKQKMQSNLLVFTDFIGIVAFALAGILAAKGKKVDPVGVFVMAFVTAFGGGIVRDLIINNRPMYWIAHSEYVWVTLFMAAFAPLIIRRFRDNNLHTLFVWSDAIGLGFFCCRWNFVIDNCRSTLSSCCINGGLHWCFWRSFTRRFSCPVAYGNVG